MSSNHDKYKIYDKNYRDSHRDERKEFLKTHKYSYKEYQKKYHLEPRIIKYKKQYSLEHKDEMKKYQQKYFIEHKTEMQEYQQEYQKRIKSRYNIYKTSSKVRGLEFNLTLKDFENIINKKCYYCSEDGYGIDRKDSNSGYLIENCLPCCTMCNRMKSDHSLEDFILKCKKIANNFLI